MGAGFPYEWLEPSSTVFPGCKKETGLEVRQLGLELTELEIFELQILELVADTGSWHCRWKMGLLSHCIASMVSVPNVFNNISLSIIFISTYFLMLSNEFLSLLLGFLRCSIYPNQMLSHCIIFFSQLVHLSAFSGLKMMVRTNSHLRPHY